MFPEEFGPFRIYNPAMKAAGIDGCWNMSCDGWWLPVILADRDACLVLAGLVRAGAGDDFLYTLRDKYNRASPAQLITKEILIAETPPPE